VATLVVGFVMPGAAQAKSSGPKSVAVKPVKVARYSFELVAVGQSNGSDTAVIQLRLSDLGFWVKDVNGVYDFSTKQAVMAFQKYNKLVPTGSVDDKTAVALAAPQHKAVGITDGGRGYADDVVEVDKARQLMFVVRGGVTVMTLNVSTGNDKPYEEPDANTPNVMLRGVSITPVGRFRVQRLRPDGWWVGDMGSIYRPVYFKGGIAVHGSIVVPAYPASHGCVRVSVMAMDELWNMNVLARGAKVWVY